MGSELLLLPDGRLSFSVHSRGSCPQTHPRPHGDSCRTPAVISGAPAALCEGRSYSPILCNTSSRLRRTSRRSAAACGTQQHLRLDSNTNYSFCERLRNTKRSPFSPREDKHTGEGNAHNYKSSLCDFITPSHHCGRVLVTSSMFAAFIHAQLSELCSCSLVFRGARGSLGSSSLHHLLQ